MGYIGATPSNAFINNDVQRVTNSTNNYVDLDHNISSLDSVIVFVNNVRQESTNLTFTSVSRIGLGDTLTTSDVVEIVFIGKAVSTQSPGTGTVSNDMLAGSIANSKLATDPLNASNLASGTVPTARLGSGTASSSTVLFGDQTYKTAPSGAWVRLGGTDATGLSDITYDVFSSTYQVYKILGSHTMSVDDAQTRMRIRKSGSDQTSSHYRYAFAEPYRSSGGSGISYNTAWNGDHVRLTQGSSSADAHPTGFEFTIYSPYDSTRQSACFLESFFYESGGNDIWKAWTGSIWLDSSTGVDITGIKFYPESGNFNNAKYSIYALKDS